ncbi:MAG: NAD-dependent epimerase/dehydratase family protein [Frankiales bacterium]|jgi:NAD(P)H dehydrogenase (quinone)|nr:NAD-dependent epimerase/dehydratase family protein [Frankiales bacterium]
MTSASGRVRPTSPTSSPAGPLVVVAGAAGKTGLAVTRAATAAGLRVRGLVHRPEQRDVVLAAGAVEAVVTDLRDEASLTAAYGGADAVYHLAPNVDAEEVPLGALAVHVARRTGVRRFVLHSVMHPYVPTMPHHVRKAEVEHLVRTSGLLWTVLQPAAYVQNLVPSDRLAVPYSVDAPFTLVDLLDVAAAAARVLTEDEHRYATYELAGPTVTSVADVARLLTERTGREVAAVRLDPDAWQAGPGAALPVDAARALRAMFDHYDRHGLVGGCRPLADLLGRTPNDVRAVIEREVPAS